MSGRISSGGSVMNSGGGGVMSGGSGIMGGRMSKGGRLETALLLLFFAFGAAQHATIATGTTIAASGGSTSSGASAANAASGASAARAPPRRALNSLNAPDSLNSFDSLNSLNSLNSTSTKKRGVIEALFAHPGKAGGGTVQGHLQRARLGLFSRPTHGIKFINCHPHPCLNGASNSTYRYVLVAVRDPVDRFRSAFDYIPSSVNEADHRNVLKLYGRDANKLAEAVCDRDPEVRAKAREHVSWAGHAKHTLTAHLGGEGGFQTLLAAGVKFYAAVLERGMEAQFDELIDSAIESLLLDAIGPTRTAALLKAGKQVVTNDPSLRHASTQTANGTTKAGSVLSPRGGACMARYLSADYESLRVLSEVACNGRARGSCQAAIGSILERRAHLLAVDPQPPPD